jgi:uncharacterized membrane protein
VPDVTEHPSGPADGDEGRTPPRVRWIDRLLDPSLHAVQRVQGSVVEPAWRRATDGESRVIVTVAIGVAIVLQATLAARVANRPQWLVAAISVALLGTLVAANPTRINRRSRALRAVTLLLIAFLSLANMASGLRLVIDLVNAKGIRDPTHLLFTGAAIWLTNVIVFALWYWEFDRGGPVARALATRDAPDFLFPQMTTPELAPIDWEPEFLDYLYFSFTNAMAFSPTDVMPMSRWAKVTMLIQSLVSLVIAVLVIARAVNILK